MHMWELNIISLSCTGWSVEKSMIVYVSRTNLFLLLLRNSVPQNKDGQFDSRFFKYKWYVNDKDAQRKEIPVCFQGYFAKYWANQEPEQK